MTKIEENWNLFCSQLDQVRHTSNGIEARCPAHNDTNPSLTASYNNKAILVRCRAGCSFSKIVNALGMKQSQFFAPSPKSYSLQREIVDQYRYENKDGRHVFTVIRFSDKTFAQQSADGQWSMDGVERIPYRLPQMLKAIAKNKAIIIVEGEKDCNSAANIGITATTFVGGCGKWRDEYLEYFKGATVCCIPDNDNTGRVGMNLIATKISKVTKYIGWLELPGLQEKGDLTDWLAIPGNDFDKLQKMVINAPKWEAQNSISKIGIEEQQKIEIHQWEKPQELTAELLPVQQLPHELIPEPLRDWLADIAHRMQVPLDFPTSACVVMLSSIIGTRLSIRPKTKDTWQVIPNLWGALIQRPAKLKSPPVQEIFRVLDKLEVESFKQNEDAEKEYKNKIRKFEMKQKISEEILRKAFKSGDDYEIRNAENELENLESDPPEKPKIHRYQTQDATPEKLQDLLSENPQGILVFRDELNGFLMSLEKEGHETAKAFYLEGWNGNGSHTLDRIGRGTVRSDLICISLFGTIQPAKIIPHIRKAKSETGNDGLFQRFQITVYPDSVKWDYIDKAPNLTAQNRAFKLFRRLAEMDFRKLDFVKSDEDYIPYINFADDAQELFEDWIKELEREKLNNLDDSFSLLEHFGKYRSLMPSLALIFHLLNVSDGKQSSPVSLKSAQQAAQWCEYLETHARRIYGMAEDITTRAAGSLSKKIKCGKLEENFTARVVHQKGWELLTEIEIVKGALTDLVEANWLREIPILPTEKGGRKTIKYQINPEIRKSQIP